MLLVLFSCRKTTFTTDPSARLTTSIDTVQFDTVFVATGSVTQGFKIFNPNAQGIRISSIRLAGGPASPFRINADGTPGPQVSDLSIAANDSVYVFVTVSINPTAANQPFVVRDSVEIIYNDHTNKVQLQAYGRNARFLKGHIVTDHETWNNDLPYVVLDSLRIQAGARLTIGKGTTVYVHANAPFIVDGSLTVQGEKWDSTKVTFTGSRLDAPYRDYPASWPGLTFTASSRNNAIHYGVLKNAHQAIVLHETTATDVVLHLSETIIDNAFETGIQANNSSLTAQNVVVSNCGKNVVLAKGGHYRFTHCTLVGFSNGYIQHKEPVLQVSNFVSRNNAITSSPLAAVFQNCIFWGEEGGMVANEVQVAKEGNAAFQLTFDHVLWRVQQEPAAATIHNAINHQSPEFEMVDPAPKIFSFRLQESSPAIDKGSHSSVTLDIEGNPRPVGLPDLGAYEKQ